MRAARIFNLHAVFPRTRRKFPRQEPRDSVIDPPGDVGKTVLKFLEDFVRGHSGVETDVFQHIRRGRRPAKFVVVHVVPRFIDVEKLIGLIKIGRGRQLDGFGKRQSGDVSPRRTVDLEIGRETSVVERRASGSARPVVGSARRVVVWPLPLSVGAFKSVAAALFKVNRTFDRQCRAVGARSQIAGGGRAVFLADERETSKSNVARLHRKDRVFRRRNLRQRVAVGNDR